MPLMKRALDIWDKRLELDEYALNLEQDMKRSKELLETIVEEMIVLWSLYNITTEEESVMTSNKVMDATIWVTDRIVRNMTPALIDQLSIYYKCDTTDDIINSVKDVVKIHIVNYAAAQNAKDTSDGIPNVNIEI